MKWYKPEGGGVVNIILADRAGFCFGVKRAVDEALDVKKKYNKPVYTFGPLIHNNDVVKLLIKNSIFPVEFDEIDHLNEGDVIIIRSHGVSLSILEILRQKKLNIIDATCPYVSNIQRKVQKYYGEGYSIIIVGDKSHPEVIGINGWCQDNAIISKDGSDIDSLPTKVCVVSQTTEKQDNWNKVLSKVTNLSKEIVAFNTICNATKERQESAEKLSKIVDVMLVLGGRNSSNTTKLYEVCKKNCKNTLHLENSNEIPYNIIKLKNIYKIGVTAGASTPDWIIKEAIIKMNENEIEIVNSNENEVVAHNTIVNDKVDMNEQLVYMEKNDNSISVGALVKGIIISVNENQAFVNIGYKADGLLPRDEVTKDINIKLDNLFSLGQEVEVKVVSRRNEDGYVVLSTIELEREDTFKKIKEVSENKETINVLVKEVVNGGLVASYNHIRVFIPASHIELFHIDDLNVYVNKVLAIKIIEFTQDRRSTKIIGSRRELLKIEKAKLEKETWETLEAGQIYYGEIERLTDFGAFVNVNGVDGLLHVSEISWGRINKPSDKLKVGEEIKVFILDIDKEKKKLSLSIKKLIEDPWINVEVKYPLGSIVLGKVVRFASFGAFIELEPGVDALVHISQISHKRIDKPSDALEISQLIKAKILEVNKESKKIGLSIKEVDEI